MKKDLHLFSKNMDVYNYPYNYDMMKVMSTLTQEFPSSLESLDYEDMMIITEAIYAHWVDGRSGAEDEKYAQYPWLEFESRSEDGYIQAYTSRVGGNFIEEYKNMLLGGNE